MSYDIGTARGVIEMDYNGRGIKKAKADLGTLEDSGGKVSKGLGLATTAVAGMGIGVVAAIGGALKTLGDFEHQLSAIEAVSGANTVQMEAMRNKALQLGADTAFSASEAASAMEELVKAGLSVDEVLNGAADAAVALAAAGGISIPEAATIAANALNTFNLEASDLNSVVDDIAGAANVSAIDVADLGAALKQAGAVANLAGFQFEDVAVAVALMGNAGIKGSDAGTSLKTMLQNLQPTTKKQIELFKSLNLLTEDGSNKFFDASGNVKSYAQVAGILDKALEGQTNQQKLLNLETLFGTDAIRAAAIAADAGAKGVRKLAEEMNATSAAEVAAKRMDNLRGSLDELGGSLETAIITAGSGLLPYLRELVDWLTETINSSVDAGQALAGELAPGLSDVFDAIGDVVSIALAVIDAFDGIAIAVGGLGLGAVIGLFSLLAGAIEAVTGLLEGQEEVILIALGAWLLLANGGIAVVAARLGWFAAYAVVQALNGFIALQGGAATTTAALKGLAAGAAAAAASLGAVALLVAAVTVWNAYKDAVEETEEALRGAADAKESGTATALADEVDKINKLIDERKGAIDEYSASQGGFDPGKFLNNAFNPTRWGDVAKLDEFGDSMGELEAASADLGITLESMGEGITGVATSMGLLDPADAEALMESFNNGDPSALAKMDELLVQLQPLLDEAGISAEQFMDAIQGDTGNIFEKAFGNVPMTLGEVQAALDKVANKSGTTRGAQESLADAVGEFSNEAMSAADQADVLKDALDRLIGVELGADQAAIAWRESLRSLKDQLSQTNGAINGGTAESDANRSAIIDSTQAIMDRVTAEAKAGTSIGKITNMFKTSRGELIKNAVAAGANEDAVRELLNSYNFTPESVRTLVQAVGVERANNQVKELTKKYKLTPEEVKTIFEAAGADTAKEKVKALRDHIKELKGKDAEVNTPGAEKSIGEIKDLRAQIKELLGKDAKIGTPGAKESATEIQRLRDQIALLQDKNVTITTTVRRVVENVASGISGMFGGGVGSGGTATPRAVSPRPVVSPGMLSSPTTASPPLVGVLPAPKTSGSTKSSSSSRLIEGELRLDPSGRAFITGVAMDADDDYNDYEDTLERMGGR